MEEAIDQSTNVGIKEKGNTKLNKLNFIFKRIASIASIVAFALAILLTLGKFITKYDNNFLSGTIYEYLISNLFGISQNDFSSSTNIIIFCQKIVLAILMIANLIITLIFAIKGIKQAIKDLRNNELNSQKYLIFIILTNTCALHLLLSIEASSSIYILYSLYLLYLFVVLIFDIFIAVFFSFKKGHVYEFVHKIIYGLLIVAVILLIKALNKPILYASSSAVTIENLEMVLLNNLISSTETNYKIVLFVMNTSLISFRFMKYSACFVVGGFYAKSMFDKEEKISFIITNYVLSLFIFIISLIELIVSLTSNAIYQLNAGTTDIAISTYPFVNLFLSAHIFAIAITSLVMARKIRDKKRRS